VLELERAEDLSKHVLEEKGQELARAKEREERLQQEIEEFKKKLAEAHDVVRSNQDVIEYLNRQLTDRDLKAIPGVGISVVNESAPRRSPLTDLLKRTEGASLGLKGSTGGGAGSGLGLGAFKSPASLAGLGTAATTLSLSGTGFGSSNGFGSQSLGSQTLALGLGITGSDAAGDFMLGTGSSSAMANLGVSAAAFAGSGSPRPGDEPLQGPVAYRRPAPTAELVAAV